MVGPVYLTEEGKAALEAELHDLIHAQRPAVIARIKVAKELGPSRAVTGSLAAEPRRGRAGADTAAAVTDDVACAAPCAAAAASDTS